MTAGSKSILTRSRASGAKQPHKSNVAVAFVATYVPRQCGIGTFTHELQQAVRQNTAVDHTVVAINGPGPERFDYPEEVGFEIHRDHLDDYQRAADFINFGDADVVCVQHEFGIYGGDAGTHLMRLLRNLRKPVVTTLHTIIADPEPRFRRALTAVANWSNMLVTMTQHGRSILIEKYGIDPSRIEVIPHGAPLMPKGEPTDLRARFNVGNRHVLLTFGLLGPGKGIETALRAVAAAAYKHPDITYFIVGATHPEVKRQEGEAYRLRLQRLARELNIRQNVVFYNRYVSNEELIDFLRICDIYVIPYPNLTQTTSGTLAYAMALGNAVISTPFAHAKEALADGRGILVDPNDPQGLGEVLVNLLDEPQRIEELKQRAVEHSRHTVWPEVGRRYVELFERVRSVYVQTVRVEQSAKPILSTDTVVEPRFDHMLRLTDDTGILQHAVYRTPNRAHGYCTDDNARALQVALISQAKLDELKMGHLTSLYLSFLHFAQRDDGLFHNFMNYQRQWLDDAGSADCQGRAIKAVGLAVVVLRDPLDRLLARQMFDRAVQASRSLTSLRARAYTIAGLSAYLRDNPEATDIRRLLALHAAALADAYRQTHGPGWLWYEGTMTYDNARLPEAMLLAGVMLDSPEYRGIGMDTLKFLTDQVLEGDHFSLIGNEGWLTRNQPKARFSQQPIDAAALVAAYRMAALVVEDDQYLALARKAMDWFLGANDQRVSLYDPGTGGCSDGLGADSINVNQGAESTLCCLKAIGLLADPANARLV